MKTINEIIAHLNPCKEAIEWLGKRTNIKKAWNKCNKADWMLWLATHYIDRKIVVLSTCDCAENGLKYIPKNENRPRKAIDTTRLWAEGKASIEEVKQAAVNAADAAYATYSADAAVNAAVNAAAANTAHAVNAAVTIADAAAAADAAYAAAAAAHAVFAADAAYAAAAAAYADKAASAASTAANTTATVYTAANVTANTANYNNYKLQKRKNLKKLASLVRKRITAEMIEESLLKSI